MRKMLRAQATVGVSEVTTWSRQEAGLGKGQRRGSPSRQRLGLQPGPGTRPGWGSGSARCFVLGNSHPSFSFSKRGTHPYPFYHEAAVRIK